MEAMAEQLDEALLSVHSAQQRAEAAESQTSSIQHQLTHLQVIAWSCLTTTLLFRLVKLWAVVPGDMLSHLARWGGLSNKMFPFADNEIASMVMNVVQAARCKTKRDRAVPLPSSAKARQECSVTKDRLLKKAAVHSMSASYLQEAQARADAAREAKIEELAVLQQKYAAAKSEAHASKQKQSTQSGWAARNSRSKKSPLVSFPTWSSPDTSQTCLA